MNSTNIFVRVGLVFLLFLLLDVVVIRDISWFIDNITAKRVWVNFLLSNSAFLLFLFILQPLLRSAIVRGITLIAVSVPLIAQFYFFQNYASFVTKFGIYSFYEYPTIVLDLWWANIQIIPMGIIVLTTYGALKFLSSVQKPVKLWRYIPNVITFILLYLITTFSWYAVVSYQQPLLAYYSTLLHVGQDKVIQINDKRAKVAPQIARSKLPNIVYIVGESLTLSHLGIYGYERNTTPELSKLVQAGKLIAFDNALSTGTHTRLSVPYMLHGIEGIDPQGRIYQTPNVFDYAKARGYNTAFIGSQDTSWGGIDRFIRGNNSVDYFIDGKDLSNNTSVHIGAGDMNVLEHHILPFINNPPKNNNQGFFLVVQMDGSHYPYSAQSGAEHKRFMPEEDKNSINAYDNSVVKTDDYIAQIVRTMREKYPHSWVFYSTDHGQSLGEGGEKFNDSFNNNVVHNSLFISPPTQYFASLKSKQSLPISQADIVPTILDIIGVTSLYPTINGHSLLREINPKRMRIVSKYTPTQYNEAIAALVTPEFTKYVIDFKKGSVVTPEQKVMRYNDLESNLKDYFPQIKQ